MKVIARKILRYIKWTFNYFYNHFLYWKYHKGRSEESKDKPVVYISLRTNIIRDSITNLVYWFINSGYKIQIHDTFLFVGSMSKLDRLILKLQDCELTRKEPSKVSIYITNRKGDSPHNNVVTVSTDYWKPDTISSWHLPEGMHPYIYFNDLKPDIEKLRIKDNRRIGVFFTGNLNEKLYDFDVIKDKFKLLTRLQIIESIQLEFNCSDLLIPQVKEDLYKDSLTKMIVINDHNKFGIPQSEYLEFLSDCNFFLFTPGVAMPLCRNNFESMAMGCIPILQYNHYHFPNLIDGKNCIVFNNEIELIEKLRYAISLSEERILEMRNEVFDYYDKYIDEISIIRNIEEKLSEGKLKELLILQG